MAIGPDYRCWPASPAIVDSCKTRGNALTAIEEKARARAILRSGGIPKALEFASKEVAELARRYQAFTLNDTTTNKDSAQKYIPEAAVIHFAAHGHLNDAHPEHSNIILLPAPGDTNTQEAYLYISEIYNLNVNAELVVLPVCNSSNGTDQRGEGIMSLARAFRYAGYPHVAASLWEVDDQAAMDVSLNFYDFLDQGIGKAEALRQAKLKRLREGGTHKAHPYYWAPMVLIGEDTPIQVQLGVVNQAWVFWLLGCGGVLLILGMLMVMRANLAGKGHPL